MQDWTLGVAALTLLAAAAWVAAPIIADLRRPAAARRRLGGASLEQGPEGAQALLQALVHWTRALAPTNEEELRGVKLRLVQAGFFNQDAVANYFAARIALLLLLPIASYAIALHLGLAKSLVEQIAAAGVGLGVGFIAPSFWLDARLKARRREHEIAFANVMDLLVVCVEAGLSFDAGLQRISEEMAATSPSMKRNLDIALLELRAGRPRGPTLLSLGERLGVPEVRAFAKTLVQAEEFGGSVGQTLRVYAADMRVRRFLKAEEYAQSLPVRLVVPLGLFIFPAILVVVTLPAIISAYETLVVSPGG